MARSRVSNRTVSDIIPARSNYPTAVKSQNRSCHHHLGISQKQSFSAVRPSTGTISASQSQVDSDQNGRDDSRRNLRRPYERRTASTMGTERKSNVTHMKPFKAAPSAEHFISICYIMPHDQKRNGILTNRVITVRSTTS